MATDLGRVKSTAASKYDALVAAQLKQAETRIRMLDLTAGLLGFAALSMAYIVGMVLCDSKFLLSSHTRQLALYVFLAGSAVYLFFAVFRPLWLRVNPYYAARQVEQQLPHAKNSIVNWVDLHEQPLPPAIHGALSQRAAKDLSRINLDQAISGRRTAWMGGLAGLFTLAFLASYFLLGPAPFLSLLKRTFNPFETVDISTRTRLTLLRPEDGNATVTVGHGVNFAVDVSGKVPDPKATDAVKLLYRYEEGDPWLERRLVQEPSGEWTTSLSALEVRNGFWYQITGGDAATKEYRIGVRAAPAILDFLATYHFRPYVARLDEVRRERALKALRGTEVLLRVRTNRILREGRLEFERNRREGDIAPPVALVRGEVDTQEPHTLLIRFIINEDGKYRLYFTSTDSEVYSDPLAYPVIGIPDQPPTVELTRPGQDLHLPADALVHLEGKASDDIGVQSLVLRMRVIGGDKLRGQPYRSDEQLRLADGGYPRAVEYKDFVDLSRVQNEDGRQVSLRGGMELEYWLEASDACDYPHSHVAESKHYRIFLINPEKNDPKKIQEKEQAEKEKKQHEQKQDQKLQQENHERQQQRQEQQARNKEEENKNKDADQGAAGEKAQPPEGQQANNSESKGKSGQQESKDGPSAPNNSEQKNELSTEDQKIEEQIKKALERKQAAENGKGEAKPDKSNSSEGKGEPSNKANGSDEAGDKSKDADKESGRQNAKQTGASNEKGQPQAGSGSSQNNDKNDKSDQKSDLRTQAAKADKGKSEVRSPSEDSKSGTDSQTSKEAGQDKKKSMDPSPDSATDVSKPADGKEQQTKGTDGHKDDNKAEQRQGHSASKDEPSSRSQVKPDAGQSKNEKLDKGKETGKPDASDSARKATVKDIEDLDSSLKSKDAHERAKAKQQLQRIAEEATDPDVRKKASETLEKAGKPDGASAGKMPKNDRDSAGKSSAERKEGEQSDGPKGTDSSGDMKDSKNTNSGQKDGQDNKGRRGSSSDEGRQEPQTSSDGTPGGGGDRRSGKGGPDTLPSPPKQPDKPRDHRAALMQLEEFAKRVNKDILKDAGVSEEAWKRYLEAKRKLLTPSEKLRPERPSAPQQAHQLPSMGGRTIQSAASGQDDAHGPDRGQPPPGYRDAFREFTRQMSKNK